MNDALAKAFKQRYNRVVSVSVLENAEETKLIQIKYRDFVFMIKEYLFEGMTSYVEVTHLGKTNTLKTYLEAEVFVADKIGEK